MAHEDLLFFLRRQVLQLGLYHASRLLQSHAQSVSILCYHSFSPQANRYAISYESFRGQIEAIKKYADIVPLSEIVPVAQGARRRRSAVAITIDDGYEDVMQLVEYTSKHNIPVTIFAMAQPEKVNRTELNHQGKLATYSDLRYLAKNGWTIGCHSATHQNLTKISSTELQREVVEAKAILEEKVGVAVDFFAYPNGYFTNEVIRAVKQAGYKAACSILPGTVTNRTNRYLLPRTVINADDTLEKDPKLYLQGPMMVGTVIDRFGPWER